MRLSTEFLGPLTKAGQMSKAHNENECIKNDGKRKTCVDAGIIRRSKRLKFPSTAMCSPYTIKGPRQRTKAQRELFIPYSDRLVDQKLEVSLHNWLRSKIGRFVNKDSCSLINLTL